jgi:hypothetical protein
MVIRVPQITSCFTYAGGASTRRGRARRYFENNAIAACEAIFAAEFEWHGHEIRAAADTSEKGS